MSQHGDTVRQRFRSYMMRVVAVVVGVPLVGIGLLTLINATVGRSELVSGAFGLAIVVGVFGGVVAVHRATVRCPSCNAWLAPVGINGRTPSSCPACKASFD